MKYKAKMKVGAISVVLVLFMTASVFCLLSYFDGRDVHGATSTGIVNAVSLNVRSGPGTNYNSLGLLSKGASISVTDTKTGTDGKAWHVTSYNGKAGYVSAQYITLDTKPKETPYDPYKTGTTTATLNVRTGPGTSYSKVTTYPVGKTFTVYSLVVSDGSSWYKTKYGNSWVYITADYVKLADGSFSLSGVSKPTTILKGDPFVLRGTLSSKYKMNNVVVGVQSSAGTWITGQYISANPGSTTYDIARADASIRFGTLAEGSYYYCIYAKDVNGNDSYALKHPFTVKGNAKPKETLYDPYKSGTTTATLNVRTGPGTSYSKVTTYAVGKTFTVYSLVVSDGSSWYKTKYGNSWVYITADYVKLADGSFSLSGVSKPTTILKGDPFVLRGTLSSKYKMNSVVVGVQSSAGTWITGQYISANPGSTTYDIARADASIRFGALAEGSYYYCIYAKDVNGNDSYALKHPFTVKGKEPPKLVIDGKGNSILSYNSSVISTIGAQPYSGPCGIYAMAYGRTVLDGYFSEGSYSTIHDRIIAEYGNGTSLAHWGKADGVSAKHESIAICYQKALEQINMGKPCILLVRNEYTNNTHYVTLIGYTKGTTASNVTLGSFIALDPGYGTLKYLNEMKYYDHPDKQLITFRR